MHGHAPFAVVVVDHEGVVGGPFAGTLGRHTSPRFRGARGCAEAGGEARLPVLVTPRSRINQGIVAVPITGVSDVVITGVANAISLTPGTLTLEVRRDPPTLYVHVLHLRSVEDTRREILYLELLLLRALAPERHDEIAWLENARRGRRE